MCTFLHLRPTRVGRWGARTNAVFPCNGPTTGQIQTLPGLRAPESLEGQNVVICPGYGPGRWVAGLGPGRSSLYRDSGFWSSRPSGVFTANSSWMTRKVAA